MPNFTALIPLGWTEFFEQQLETLQFNPETDQIGRVLGRLNNVFLVHTGEEQVEALLAGAFRHRNIHQSGRPVVGDWVIVKPAEGDTPPIIHILFDRQSSIARLAPGAQADTPSASGLLFSDRARHLIAANIDVAFIVMALDEGFSVRRLERFLISVHDGDIKPVIVLNKADLADDPDALLTQVQAVAGETPVHVFTATTATAAPELEQYTKAGETVAFLGTSGVGKSTLTNLLLQGEVQATSAVRETDQRGRHTTTERSMHPLANGGWVIDNPGVREFQPWASERGLRRTFPDIYALAEQCQFRGCAHDQEPGCAVKDALASGELNQERFDNYKALESELSGQDSGRGPRQQRSGPRRGGRRRRR